MSSKEIKATRNNNFGFLRLLFATMVIVTHSFEFKYLNVSSDPLAAIFGSVTLGDLSVDGFFLISGYLITKSFAENPNVLLFMKKRILRIYPGFIVASIVCLVPIAAAGGSSVLSILHQLPMSLIRMLLLLKADNRSAFVGSNYPVLDGSMWTISFEAICYTLVVFFGKTGLLVSKTPIAFIGVVCIVVFEVFGLNSYNLSNFLRLTGVYCFGSCFFLWKEHIRFRLDLFLVSIVALCFCLRFRMFAEPAIIVFGGYIIFFVAVSVKSDLLSRINNRNDISYGVYLYAWPIGKLLLWYFPSTSATMCCLLTIVISYTVGAISWFGVEKPAMRVKLDQRLTLWMRNFKVPVSRSQT